MFLPSIMLASAFSIALAALIPIGFLFGLIEHKYISSIHLIKLIISFRFALGWALLVAFVQVGGVLDLVADISLIANFFIDEIHTAIGEGDGVHSPSLIIIS